MIRMLQTLLYIFRTAFREASTIAFLMKVLIFGALPWVYNYVAHVLMWQELSKPTLILLTIIITLIYLLYIIAKRANDIEAIKFTASYGEGNVFNQQLIYQAVQCETQIRIQIRNKSKTLVSGVRVVLGEVRNDLGLSVQFENVIKGRNAAELVTAYNPDAVEYYHIASFFVPRNVDEITNAEVQNWGDRAWPTSCIKIGNREFPRGSYTIEIRISWNTSPEYSEFFRATLDHEDRFSFCKV